MTFQYAWLKILEVLAKRQGQMTLGELRGELGRVGFPMDGEKLDQSLDRLRAEGLVEALVLAGGGTQAVTITTKGERKVRGIVRF